MSDDTQSRRRELRLKTWSRFGNLGRKPSEYEIVTHNMNHTMKEVPLEIGPGAHGNRWIRKHRDGMALAVDDWDGFRDPDKLIYRDYTKLMDEQETYVDSLLEEYDERLGIDATFGASWLDALSRLLTPFRYPGHGLQMMAAYVQQFAPSSYVQNCATFQVGDELRRVQRLAYRTKQLALAHPSRSFGSGERDTWERHPAWQPCREAIERLLVTFTWDEAFTALNLVVKPVVDEIFLKQFAHLARKNGDELDALIADNLYLDAERSRRWSAAVARFAIGRAEANREVFARFITAWRPHADKIVLGAAPLFSEVAGSGIDADAFQGEVRAAWQGLLSSAGL